MRSSVRSLRAVVVLVAATLAVSGCVGTEPTFGGYGDVGDTGGYYGTFMFGCTGVEPNEAGEYVNHTLESQEFCRCVFEGLSARVPFPEVQALEREQAEADSGEFTLPRSIDSVRQECAELA